MDLGAVKAAKTPELVRCAVGAAANAQDLLGDAEVLSAAARPARAYALAALAVEEAGKAASLCALAIMPISLRAQAPLGRLLEWHQLKLVGGMMLAAVPTTPTRERTMAAQLAAMSASQIAEVLENARALAADQDRLKQRGLYADIDAGGRVRLPSEVSEHDVVAQLDRARQAVSSASVLLVPYTPAWLANPPTEVIVFCRALVSEFAEAGYSRTPEAAANWWLGAVRKLQEQLS